MKQHTFVICAYKESCYLKECISSLKRQTMESNIIIVTSTPNEYIEKIAKTEKIELFINNGVSGIVQDWNFAYLKASTKYVTIAHQDDVYYKNYTKRALEALNKASYPLIYFTNYLEIRDGEKIAYNKILYIKRILLAPLRITKIQKNKTVRRIILSFGSAICCPSVTFAKENLPKKIFEVGFRSDEDWEAWEKISRYKGEFIYDKEILVGHRIHEDSETSIILEDNARRNEDYIMFCKFWPKCIAKILTKLYATSEQSNNLQSSKNKEKRMRER